ncbi:hypothetical protein TNCT_182501 [Trichonephila clavata]|uniref:Uncharacterized protein n=1 Tax=Trichonephila clavata TaxID=2740835 RepID=A0A8X6IXV4_TRICU|nr:hypothetical protein TNCT_182501 [Trichonephila clavata]
MQKVFASGLELLQQDLNIACHRVQNNDQFATKALSNDYKQSPIVERNTAEERGLESVMIGGKSQRLKQNERRRFRGPKSWEAEEPPDNKFGGRITFSPSSSTGMGRDRERKRCSREDGAKRCCVASSHPWDKDLPALCRRSLDFGHTGDEVHDDKEQEREAAKKKELEMG